MKHFLRTLGIISLVFAAVACDDDKKDDGGNGNTSSATSVNEAFDKACSKYASCAGQQGADSEAYNECVIEFYDTYDVDGEVPSECKSEAIALFECMSKLSCEQLEEEYEDGTNCGDESYALEDCLNPEEE
ncbi:MAG: hypothetical protein IJU23_15210 [Proteobacteria bacterium]|nr:hypothetical protein [Pseudomonadota bacterium]